MRNIAKCKKCQSVIESFHPTDYVSCSCGEISVEEGLTLKCSAKDWSNFLRVDDEGNEIVVRVETTIPDEPSKLTKIQKLDMLDEMIRSYERLPQSAMSQPVSNYDLISSLLLLSSILRSD
jgi:hypothetical protein